MTAELLGKHESLKRILLEMGSVAVGYSGGVDSTLLLKVAVDQLGDRAVAMIGRSDTYPVREYEDAMEVARSIGARTFEVATEETDIIKFRENPSDRCYHCKTELFGKLAGVARTHGLGWVADGTITDDTGDYRPGMKARSEHGVRSPLLEAGFNKNDVRELSRHLGLPTWDKPSFACLASRFPYGMEITRENLSRVDAAEMFLRDRGFRAVRVRFHDERTARIEVHPAEIARLVSEQIRGQVVEYLKGLGFVYVTMDLQGYRTGSMNEVIPAEVIIQGSTRNSNALR